MYAEAEQPEDWDEEEDGEWEPPRITNPKCEAAPGCGEWERSTKINPAYKGTWYPPMIDNPEYKVTLPLATPVLMYQAQARQAYFPSPLAALSVVLTMGEGVVACYLVDAGSSQSIAPCCLMSCCAFA